MELHRFLVGDGKQWDMAAKCKAGHIFLFPFISFQVEIHFLLWLFGSEFLKPLQNLELLGDLLRPSLVVAFPLRLQWSFLTAPLACPAVRSECLVWQVGQELGAWSDGSGWPWEMAPPSYPFSFIFLFPWRFFCLCSFTKPAGSSWLKIDLLSFTDFSPSLEPESVVTFSGVNEHSEGARKSVPFLQKANQETHVFWALPPCHFQGILWREVISYQGVWVEGPQFHFLLCLDSLSIGLWW